MSKRKSIFSIIFSLIFSLFLVNCDVFSFNGDLQSQIIKDTTFTIIFHAYNYGPDYDESKVLVKHYSLKDTITSDEFPTGYDSEIENWKPDYLIRGWSLMAGVSDHYITTIPGSGGQNYVKEIDVASLTKSDDFGTYTIELYPDWFRARIITLYDERGKPYSGDTANRIMTETGVDCPIPLPSTAVYDTSDNNVVFDSWYTDSACSVALSQDSNGDYYFSDSDATHLDISLYAKWKYQYVFVDPQDASGNSSDDNTGMDSSKPVKTITEAKKYLKTGHSSTPRAIKLMSTINGNADVSALTGLTTTTYNNAILLRNRGFDGAMINIDSCSTSVSITNLIIDGGANWGGTMTNPTARTNTGIKAKYPVIYGATASTGDLTLDNVIIQNNDNESTDTATSASCISIKKPLDCTSCKFIYNSSYIFPGDKRYSSAINCWTTSTSLSYFDSTEIKYNKGNGLYVGSTANLVDTVIGDNSLSDVFVALTTDVEIGGDTKINKVYLESKYTAGAERAESAFIYIAGSLPDTSTIVAQITSDNCAHKPIVLKAPIGTTRVSTYLNCFTCTTDGYVIKLTSGGSMDPGYIDVQSIGFGIDVDIPVNYTEVSPGDLATVNVYRSEGKIIFHVDNAAYDAITTWSGQKPIQYMINDKYGCVPIQGSAGNYYAEIIINGAIPSDFEGNYTEPAYTVPLGLNDLQIFSTAADETTVIIKKNYKIIVQ